jgi:hypothetical protein
MKITKITPLSWLKTHNILLYKKKNPTKLDNYCPITLANAIYTLLTTCNATMPMKRIESRKIMNHEQEECRVDRRRARAVTHLGLCVENAPTRDNDIVLCYLDFKGAFP